MTLEGGFIVSDCFTIFPKTVVERGGEWSTKHSSVENVLSSASSFLRYLWKSSTSLRYPKLELHFFKTAISDGFGVMVDVSCTIFVV